MNGDERTQPQTHESFLRSIKRQPAPEAITQGRCARGRLLHPCLDRAPRSGQPAGTGGSRQERLLDHRAPTLAEGGHPLPQIPRDFTAKIVGDRDQGQRIWQGFDMAENSKIEWTDASWNPIRACNKATGKIGWYCEHASEGCRFCYAEAMNRRLGTGLDFKPGHRADVDLFLDNKMLAQPYHWKRPRMVFVCSMTDLFAEFVLDAWIDRIFTMMALCPQHSFQVLTKRSERMRHYMTATGKLARDGTAGERIREAHHWARFDNAPPWQGWPLPNVWLGISAERQQESRRAHPRSSGDAGGGSLRLARAAARAYRPDDRASARQVRRCISVFHAQAGGPDHPP